MLDTRKIAESEEKRDPLDSYFECITACSWLGGEDVDCVTRCIQVHLKEEFQKLCQINPCRLTAKEEQESHLLLVMG